MGRKYHDKDWLQHQYSDLEKTTYEIARLCDVAANTIQRWLHRHDIEVRKGGAPKGESTPRYDELHNREWLETQYYDKELSQKEISDKVGCSYHAVELAFERNDIETRDVSVAQRAKAKTAYTNVELEDKEWLKEKYENNNLREIARELDITGPSVAYWIDQHGIERKDRGGPFGEPDTEFQRDPEWPERRKAALERDNHTCQDCGMNESDYGRSLDVHHLEAKDRFLNDDGVDWEAANAKENLISLCRSCHIKRHTN